ncbi:DUF2058 domain-containing protein [Lysobacter sp. D1-1-M9]|uniref:DUF2058 domain-containing protein n=1 Tax=Novilysobacter longmucuonensis TaxID=3098603 RepID=UPI002FC65C13
MRNPMQDQLLKAGLVKKNKVAQVLREQAKQRHAKAAPADDEKVDARRLQAERAERDRALAAERNAQARLQEFRAQVRQIIDANRVDATGEEPYSFDDQGSIRRIHVDAAQRQQLAKGSLVIVRDADGYVLLPGAAAQKVRERDASLVVLDNRQRDTGGIEDEDPYYSRFKVPDDLVW